MALLAANLADAARELLESLRENSYGANVSTTMILDAIARRDDAQQTATIVRLTWWIAGMTVVVAIATVINLAVFLARG